MPRAEPSLRAAFVLAAALALAGCAAVPRTFGFANADPMLLFPAAGGADPPRYAYVGQLLGESNLVQAGETEETGLRRAWRWIAGLDSSSRSRVDLARPQCVVGDPEGRRIYVSDAGRKAVFAFDLDAGTLAVWSRAGSGLEFGEPVGLAWLANGDVLVADADRGVVFRVDARGRAVATIGQGRLSRPTGIATDPVSGRLYVADTGAHRIAVFDREGAFVSSFGRRGSGEGELNFPTHVAWARDRLYVTDSINGRVQAFDADGAFRGVIGRPGLYVGELSRPKGVAADSAGRVFVVESLYAHLLLYDDAGRFLLGWGGTGARAGEFHLPAGVWVDAHDRVYVADMFNARVSVFRPLPAVAP